MQVSTRTLSPEPEMSPQQTGLDMTKHIAENIFKDLRSFGLQDKDIVAVSSELINHLTIDIRARSSASPQGQASR